MSISQSASPTAESETCAICSTVPDAADRRMVCAQCVDAFFAGSGPVSESAEELIEALESCVSVPSLDRNTFLWDSERAAALIAADRAETLRKAADRYCQCKCAWPSAEWEHPDQCECTERAAILGEGKA